MEVCIGKEVAVDSNSCGLCMHGMGKEKEL